jgi:hypothetical protein
LSDIVSFTSAIFAGLGLQRQRVRRELVRGLEHLLEERPGLARDHDFGAFRHIGPGAAGVVHVVMGEHQLLDRLARILGLGRVNDPARLPFADRSVEDHDPVLHRDDQAVVGAADHVLHVRPKLGEL